MITAELIINPPALRLKPSNTFASNATGTTGA